MKKSRAFTLIELLVVIAVIGILAGVLLAVINPLEQLKKTRDAQRKHDLTQIQKALEIYYNDNGKYPPADANTGFITDVYWGGTWPGYMEVVPQDPSSEQAYSYTTRDGGYELLAALDRCPDSQATCDLFSVTSPNLAGASGGGVVTVPTPRPTSITPTSTSSPTPTITPTPTPTQIPGLVAYWNMNELSGTTVANSSSTTGINGTSISSTNISDGKFGKARTFNGTSDYIWASNNSLLNIINGLTFAAWLNIDNGFTGYGGVFSRGSFDNGWDILINPNTSIDFRSSCLGATDNFISTNISPGSGWHHLVVTFDSSTHLITTYRDGASVASVTQTGTLCGGNTQNYIGTEMAPGNSQRKFKGLIDDIRIYNHALSPTEIQGLYGFVPPPPFPFVWQPGKTFYKVRVSGIMSDTNVYNACNNAGYTVPCSNEPNGVVSDNLCRDVGFRDGITPMETLALAIGCADGPSNTVCVPMRPGTFQYMGQKWQSGSSCGSGPSTWCEQGNDVSNYDALCVSR